MLRSGTVLRAHQPRALLDALPLIAPLHTPGMTLQLECFTLTAALADSLRAAEAAGWGGLCLPDITWERGLTLPSPLSCVHAAGCPNSYFDDRLLRETLRLFPAARELVVGDFSWTKGPPRGVTVPWEVIHMEHVSDDVYQLQEWLAQVQLLGGSMTWECEDMEFYLTREQVRDTHTQTRSHGTRCIACV